jgi:hypothetical protein
MYPSVATRELTTITSDYATENIFFTDGLAVHNRNYETGHQLAKTSSAFSAPGHWSMFKYALMVDI